MDGSTHHRRRATIPLSNKSFDDIEGSRSRSGRACADAGKACEMLSEEEAPLLTGYRGVAGSHVGHYQPRRESILFRPSVSDSDSSPLSLSRKISANSDLLPEDLLITPFAQILHTLRNVRNSFVTLSETCTASLETGQNGTLRDISDGESSKMAVETLEDLDWCLEQLEKVQTHRSVSDMATTKFKRILSRELNQFSETGSSASEVSEYINSTFLEKYKDTQTETAQNHVIARRTTSSSEEPRDDRVDDVTAASRASSFDSSNSSHDNDNVNMASKLSSNQVGRKQLWSINRHLKTSLVVTLDPSTMDDLQLSTPSTSSSLSTSPSSNQIPPQSSSSSSSPSSSSSSSNQNAPQSGRSLSSSSSSAATIVPSQQHHHHHQQHHHHHQQQHRYHHHYHQSKVSKLEPILERACDWSFDVFHLADVTSNRPLLVLTNYIFEKHNLLNALNVPATVLLNFLNSVEQNYNNNNSYHNNIHAADVVQSTYCLLNTPSIKDSLTDMDLVATIISAAVHDIDHPGVTNQYLINSELDLAILYNDRSVLENHHLAVTFTILKDKEVNIFQNLPNPAYRSIRRMIIDMVLATDMSLHLKLVADLKTMVETQKVIVTNRGKSSMSPQPASQPPLTSPALAVGVAAAAAANPPPEHRKILLENQEDKMQVLQTLVHCADLGNPAKHISLFRQWVERITREFFQQGDMEREQGLDISPMCNRDIISVEKAQVGFIDYIALPLWEAWDELVNHEVQEALDNLLFNRDWFESQEREKVKGTCANN